MKFQLLSQVVLANDWPNTIFKSGDVATMVEAIEGKKTTQMAMF